MEQKPVRFISVTTWLIIIVVINFILFLFYLTAAKLPFSGASFWTYMETDVFKLVTGSLIIPLLFSILEKRYKFMENIQKQREEKQKENEQRRRNSRQEAIKDTLNMWQELYNLTSEIIFFNKKQQEKRTLHDIIMDLNRYSSTAEHIVNKWAHQFPNLKPEDHDVFLYFINLLYHADQTAAYYILSEERDEEVAVIQNVLFQIQDQVKTILNHTIADIFKYSARYLELQENHEETPEAVKTLKEINNYMDTLKSWREALKTLDEKHDNFLSTAKGPQVDEVRKTAKKIQQWLRENKSKYIYESPDFSTLEKQYYEVPLKERMAIIRIPYTRDYLMALADWLSFESASKYLYDRVHDRW
jgi:hypothetical protein